MTRVLVVLFLLVVCTEAYDNLALHKPAWQKTTWTDKPIDWGAAKAVDGQYTDRGAGGNQCSISADGQQTAEWRVDLQSVVSISYINIFYRTDNFASPGAYYDRFAGFFVYVSNTTSREEGHLCFHELQQVNGTPTENQTINCPVHGRYVLYFNERRPDVTYPNFYSTWAFSELCELEVNGCSDPTFYGVNCDQPCSENCQERRCTITTGECLGCIPGYQGPKCYQVCDNQRYGLGCSLTCGNCSDGVTCNHVNGTCLNGCDVGVQGDKCQTACRPGRYGKDCREICSENCLRQDQCNRFNGECYGGCQPGWKLPNCQKECDGGLYGVNCSQSCGQCMGDRQCHHINGTCLNGCSPGYLGDLCTNPCDDGRWGQNCLQNCSTNCVNETCVPETGRCYQSKFLGQPDDKSSSTLPVIAGIFSALFIIITSIIVFLVIKRFRSEKGRKRGHSQKSDQRKTLRNKASNSNNMEFTNIYANVEEASENKQKPPVQRGKIKTNKSDKNNDKNEDIDIDEKVHEENPYGDLYLNEEEVIPDIAIDNLDTVIKEKQREDNDGFKREYAALPYGERRRCTAGKLPENLSKNRFKTTFPYDHSRVKLKNHQSDYINANYIHGIEKDMEYIASQGPKQNTLKDFLAMIWQENVSQIVMLTNLKEGNKTKCVQYWPELNKVLSSGEFSISNKEENIYAFYVIRRLKVTHKNKTSFVTQYHYTAWPDHGVPEPLSLVVFHDHVTRTRNKQNPCPVLVHCSAGIGRTGTYLAIDAFYKTGQKERKINIAEYAKRMRENRMNMVQTYEQYITIFLVLSHMFKACSSVLKKSDFIRKAESMTTDKPANQSDLRGEFQSLLKVRPTYTEEDYKHAIQAGHGKRSYILPLDKYSLFLSSNVPKRGGFINAVTLSSYVNNKAFIVTHYPPLRDAVDFLRLLTDHESDVVVCMDPLPQIDSSKMWMPGTDESKIVAPFIVHCQKKTSDIDGVKCSTIQIFQEKQSDEAFTVSVSEPKFSLLSTEHGTSNLLTLVSFAMDNKTQGPITVISSDGAVLCGVFCAVYNVIQQLSVDGEVDIFTAVRQLQIRRPEICSSLEEYKMIHTTVLEYTRLQQGQTEENIYSNE